MSYVYNVTDYVDNIKDMIAQETATHPRGTLDSGWGGGNGPKGFQKAGPQELRWSSPRLRMRFAAANCAAGNDGSFDFSGVGK